MSERALHIEDLAKRYPTGVEALRGVSLEIEPGEFYGLLGPNGAGKSTLIHCTTGLAQPTAGAIRVFGHDAIGDYGEARQAVGLAPQELNLDWFLTVEETLDFHGGYFGMPGRERRERARELLEIFSLTDKRDERTRTLSGGMKRRLILARALMHRPRLLILDEPTAGVDIELRLELWHYVQRINQEGTTILLTTHYLEEAEQLCGKIALINNGQIAARGTSAELTARYGVQSLEDAYLTLVGRKELSRSHIEEAVSMSAAQIRLLTLWRREVSRFMKIKRQTIGAPLLETFLYISVFGAALGSRVGDLHGIDYVVFVIPGLIMMAFSINAFANNSSSILQQKFQGAIQDQLSSPASPLELLMAFSLGGFVRGLAVASLTFVAASLLVDLPVDHILVLIPSLFLVGFFFSQLGVLVGIRAEQFDDVALAQTFVLQPLIFLGGVFYSASLLPEPFQTLTHFNPVYYMINLVRYGFLDYTEASVPLSLLALTGATAALFVGEPTPIHPRLQTPRLTQGATQTRGNSPRLRCTAVFF